MTNDTEQKSVVERIQSIREWVMTTRAELRAIDDELFELQMEVQEEAVGV